MTELEYVLRGFAERFAPLRDKRIVLHGTREYAEAIIERMGDTFSFVGIMSLDPLEGKQWHGLPVLAAEDLGTAAVDLVILTERVKYAEAAFQSIQERCAQKGIAVFNMYGVDEFAAHRSFEEEEPMTRERMTALCEGYDLIAFEVMTVLLYVPEEETELAVRDDLVDLIGDLRARGKTLRFSLRKSFPEAQQIAALRKSGLLAGEEELIRREGEDLSFRRLRERHAGEAILYFGYGLVNEFLLPRCYGIDTRRYVPAFELTLVTPEESIPAKRFPFRPEWREEIENQIRAHTWISFDVFDTLVLRKTLFPRDVYPLTQRRALREGIPAAGFAEARAEAEDRLVCGSLDEIYAALAASTDLDAKTLEKLRDLELETEREVLELRESVAQLLFFAQREGKHVVLTSDMYLPEAVMRELLAEKGLTGFERIFVSCDYKKGKLDGLFDELLALSGGADQLLHIGDNPYSDIEACKARGIECVRIPSALSLAKRRGWAGAIAAAGNLTERCLVGLCVSRLFADPFENPNLWERPTEERMRRYGISVVGPLVVGQMSWMIEKFREEAFDGVLFLARDGWLPGRVYGQLWERFGLPRPIYYYANRHAAFLCCADSDPETGHMARLRKAYGLDGARTLCDVYQLKPEELLPPREGETVLDYIRRHSARIREIAESARKGYLRYSEACGMRPGESYAVVDFVAIGNTQKCLATFLPYHLKGLYYGGHPHKLFGSCEVEYYLQGENPLLLKRCLEVECFFTSPEPSQSEMTEEGEPRFQKEIRSETELRDVRIVQESAEAFGHEFFRTLYGGEESIAPRLVEEIYAAEPYHGVRHEVYDDWFKVYLTGKPKKKPAPDRGGEKVIPIVMAFDRAYLLPSAVAVFSALEHGNRETCYEFHFFTGEEDPEMDGGLFRLFQERFPNFRYRYEPFREEVFAGTAVSERLSPIIFARLSLMNLFPEWDACLYLDGDTLVLRDLAELWELAREDPAFENACLMAAQDLPLQNGRGRFFAQFRRDYGEEDLSGYFNSGVLVMNLKRLRETKRFERFAELARKSYQFPDQDILNRCCKGEVAYLPAVWNMFPGTLLQKESLPGQGCTEQDRDDIRAGRAALLHFAGEAKPWKSVRTLYDMEWLLYAERLPRTEQTAPFLENARNQVEEEELPDRMEELREARYILFGFTFMSRELADDLLARKFRKPLCFCDSNPDKQGKSYRGIPCLSVEEARKLLDAESFVVICSQQRWREVLDRLHRLDIPDAQILRLHFDNLSITAAEKPYGIGLLMGVFDLFHIGHLNLIRRAKAQCRFLRVGVLADELVYSFKKIHPTIPQEERMEILRALRDVDEVVLLEEQEDVSRLNEWKKRPFDCFFSGDDYVGNPYWDWEREELRKLGADLVFFPYTKQRSSSMIRRELKERGASESK